MRQWIWFGIGVQLLLQTSLLPAQAWSSLPKVEPAQIVALDQDDQPMAPCIDDIVWDAQGRLWLSTCGTYSVRYRMPILQYDGYQLSPVNQQEQIQATHNFSHLVDMPGKENVWSYLWSREGGVMLSLAENKNQENYYSLPKGNGFRLIHTKNEHFFVESRDEDYFHIYSWDTLQAQHLFSLQWPETNLFPSRSKAFTFVIQDSVSSG